MRTCKRFRQGIKIRRGAYQCARGCTFCKGGNADTCNSDNHMRQHDILSEEGRVLEITDRYTYKNFVQLTDGKYRPFFFPFSYAEIFLCPSAGFILKNFHIDLLFFTFTSKKPVSVTIDNINMK